MAAWGGSHFPEVSSLTVGQQLLKREDFLVFGLLCRRDGLGQLIEDFGVLPGLVVSLMVRRAAGAVRHLAVDQLDSGKPAPSELAKRNLFLTDEELNLDQSCSSS